MANDFLADYVSILSVAAVHFVWDYSAAEFPEGAYCVSTNVMVGFSMTVGFTFASVRAAGAIAAYVMSTDVDVIYVSASYRVVPQYLTTNFVASH